MTDFPASTIHESMRIRDYKRQVILFALVGSVHAFAITIHNHTEAFERFWRQTSQLPATERVRLFHQRVVPLLPDFYRFKLDQWRQEKKDIGKTILDYLSEYPSYRDTFMEVGKNLPGWLRKASKEFKRRFREFNDDIEIHILNSFDEMDGGTRQIAGKQYFIFGAESIAKYHRTLTYESKLPFLHHEIFHMYHRQFFTEDDSLYSGLWVEGLAVYVAELLNPNATKAQLSLENPKDLIKDCEKNLPRLLNDLDKRLNSTNRADYILYFSGSSSHPWISKRAGYYLGYRVIKALAAEMSVERLAKKSKDEVLPLLRKGLLSIQKNVDGLRGASGV